MSANNGGSATPAPGANSTIILIVNDLHLADRPPLGRKPGYMEEILTKVREIREMQETVGACAVLFTGDIFHSKQPGRVSHELVTLLQRALPDNSYIIPGNHDMGPGGLSTIIRQPFSSLQDSVILLHQGRWVHLEDEEDVEVKQPDVYIFARPYDRECDVDPTYYQLTPEELETIKDIEPPTSVIVLAHGSILPPGEQRPYPYINADQIDMTGIDVLASGHIHEPLGVHRLGDNPENDAVITQHFVNIGSVSRPSRTKVNMTHRPAVLMLTIEEGFPIRFTTILLEHVKPAEEVFVEDILDLARSVEGIDDIVDFAEAIAQGMESEQVPLEELLAQVPDIPDIDMKQLRAMVTHYLERAGV